MSTESEDNLPDVVVGKRSRFSIIWVVPIIALAVASWLIYHSYAKRGPVIEITFKDGSGLVEGKTDIQYLGVKVGTVNSVKVDEKLSNVVVTAELTKTAMKLATEGAAYWVVRPEIGFGGIRGLDTLISGPYIGVSPGKGTTKKNKFIGLLNQPPASPNEPGLNIVLQSEKAGSLKNGDPVYYREFQVGAVDKVSLASDAQSVHAHVHIKEDYGNLIRENTKFWNASGIGMDFSLFGGAKIKTESLASILSGGVAFVTPPDDQMGAKVSDGTVFKLYDEPEDDWAKWSPSISISSTEYSTNGAVASDDANSAPIMPDANNATVANPAGSAPITEQSKDPAPAIPHHPPGSHR